MKFLATAALLASLLLTGCDTSAPTSGPGRADDPRRGRPGLRLPQARQRQVRAPESLTRKGGPLPYSDPPNPHGTQLRQEIPVETTVSVSSSADLARRVAQAADILAELPPSLPALAAVSVHEGGRVDLYPDWPDRERNVLKWAITLNGTAMLDMSNSGYLVVVVPFGGGEARIESYLPQRRAYELGALLQTPVTPGGQVQVDPAALLAALDAEAAGKRVSS